MGSQSKKWYFYPCITQLIRTVSLIYHVYPLQLTHSALQCIAMHCIDWHGSHISISSTMNPCIYKSKRTSGIVSLFAVGTGEDFPRDQNLTKLKKYVFQFPNHLCLGWNLGKLQVEFVVLSRIAGVELNLFAGARYWRRLFKSPKLSKTKKFPNQSSPYIWVRPG